MYPEEEERRVFQCVFGQTMIHADPIAVHRRMKICTGGRFGKLIEDANVLNARPDEPGYTPPPEDHPEHLQALIARGVLAGAVIQAFELQPFDPMTGQGVLEEEALALLYKYLVWMDGKKKVAGHSSSQRTDPRRAAGEPEL